MILVRRYIYNMLSLITAHGWRIIVVLLILLYGLSYLSMLAFGEQEVVENFAWWFIVTATTVGYGDFAPVTGGGRITAACVMIFSIGAVALFIGKLSQVIIDMVQKNKRGLAAFQWESHLLILGYVKDETERVVSEYLHGKGNAVQVIVCSNILEENPFEQGNVEFVRGSIASQDVLKRASAKNAGKIIVFGHDDGESFLAAYTVRQGAEENRNLHAHMAVSIRSQEMVTKIRNLPSNKSGGNEPILISNSSLLVQEIEHPGSSKVIQHLASNLVGANLCRIDVPLGTPARSYGEYLTEFRRQYGVTLVALENSSVVVNPPDSADVKEGMGLFYASEVEIPEIDWGNH